MRRLCFLSHALRPLQEYYNQDATYKVAYEDLTELRPLAAGLVDLWLSGGMDAYGARRLKLKVRTRAR